MRGPEYPPGVPNKFDPDGNVQRYPGNTFICHLSPSSEPELYSSLPPLHDKLTNHRLSHLYTLLPPSSYHMTVFEGVCEVRQPGRWPDDLPVNASLEECTSLYEKKLSSFDLNCDPPYHLSIEGINLFQSGIQLHLVFPMEENARIRDLRDRLSKLLRIRKKGHDSYGFHLSVAYMLRFLTDEQNQELTELLVEHFEARYRATDTESTSTLIALVLACTMASKPTVEGPKYPSGVPNKFDPDGNVQPFPGNTTVCHLPPTSELYKSLLDFHEKLKSSHLRHLHTLLPPSSWHMTMLEGVCDKVRSRTRWPDDLSVDASLEECTSLYKKRLSSFDLQCDAPYHLTILKFKPLNTAGIGVHLEPSTPEENARLRRLRDRLSKLLHIRAKNHKTYVFHLSVAYMLRFLTEEQDKEMTELLTEHFEGMPKEFELGPPEFCTFESMFAFKQLFYLKKKA
ncbi:RNA ligase/cyclic nucleotide phosphodiesterase [Mycena galopus ATCC 62051]|nr:RNA ligase/cyclic nucleotide phosphodiesterase [Mycena galopus ATCC 62051]